MDDSYVSSIQLSTVTPRPVDYIWKGRLARGMAAIWDGDPATGKTSAAMDIAARITTGRGMPGEEGADTDDTNPRRGVLLLTAEDSLEQTIRPRMEAAGADLNKVGVVVKRHADSDTFGTPVIPDDIEGIENQVIAFDADLILIDPIMGYISGSLDSNNDQNIRAAMAPLIGMIARRNCGLLVIRHLNKATGISPMYRGGGSIGMSGIVRFGMTVARDPNDITGDTRVIAPYKVNVGKEPRSIQYRLVSAVGYDVARVEWMDEVDISAADLLIASMPESERNRLRDCMEWLRQEMDSSPTKQPLQKDVKSKCTRDGFAWEEVKKAMASLNIGTWRQDATQDMVLHYRDTAKPGANSMNTYDFDID